MRYWVDVREIHFGRIAVEAEDESEALANAKINYKIGNTTWTGTDYIVTNAVLCNAENLFYGQ